MKQRKRYRFEVKIETSTGAFGEDLYGELCRILNELSTRMASGYRPFDSKLADVNGNTVGSVGFVEVK